MRSVSRPGARSDSPSCASACAAALRSCACTGRSPSTSGAIAARTASTRQLRRRAQVAVGERHVERATAAGEGEPHHRIGPRGGAGEDRAQADRRRGAERLHRRRERRGIQDHLRLLQPDRRGRGGQVLQEPGELELGEERPRPRVVRGLPPEALGRERQLEIAPQRDEPAVRPDALRAGDDLLLHPLPAARHRLRDLLGTPQHLLHAPEVTHERGGGHLSDPGDPGHVVDLVAEDGHVLDHLVRPDAELLLHLRRSRPPSPPARLRHRVVERELRVDELREVLVAGDDDDVPAALARAARERADDVVRLDPGLLDDRHRERARHVAHERELRLQVVRRLGAVRLVAAGRSRSGRLAPGVEDERDVRRRVLAQRLEQHRREPVGGVGRHALRRREVRDRVVGAEDEARAVDEGQRGHERAGR